MIPVFLRARVARLFPLLFVLAAPWASAADVFNPAGELTLVRAMEAALRFNPELRSNEYELTAAQARAVQAQLRPNPELTLEIENFAGSGDFQRANALETTLSLSQVVELGGKRALRRVAADFEIEGAAIEQSARQLDVLAEIARRFIDLVVSQERVEYANAALKLARETADAIDMRVRAGRSPEAERSRARVALIRADIELRQAESLVNSARQRLAASWGSVDPAFGRARAQLFELPKVDSLASLQKRVDESPDFTRFASLERQRDAELRLARAQARSNLTFSLGVRRFESTNDSALVAGFSMPLTLHDRNQGGIREAMVRVQQTTAQREAARVQVLSSLASLYQEMTAAGSRLDMLRDDALPQAQIALEQTRSGYERGRFSFLELATVQEELLALRSASIDAAADYHRMLVEIERLSGTALTRSNP